MIKNLLIRIILVIVSLFTFDNKCVWFSFDEECLPYYSNGKWNFNYANRCVMFNRKHLINWIRYLSRLNYINELMKLYKELNIKINNVSYRFLYPYKNESILDILEHCAQLYADKNATFKFNNNNIIIKTLCANNAENMLNNRGTEYRIEDLNKLQFKFYIDQDSGSGCVELNYDEFVEAIVEAIKEDFYYCNPDWDKEMTDSEVDEVVENEVFNELVINIKYRWNIINTVLGCSFIVIDESKEA